MPPSTRVEHHLSAKLDECAPFGPWNGAGVRLKQAEYGSRSEATFLPCNTRIRVWVITRSTNGSIGSHGGEQLLGPRFSWFAQHRLDAPTLPYHLLSCLNEFLVELLLLSLFSSPLRLSCRWSVLATCRAERRRERHVCCTLCTCSLTSPLARCTKRESTRTLSTSKPLPVG